MVYLVFIKRFEDLDTHPFPQPITCQFHILKNNRRRATVAVSAYLYSTAYEAIAASARPLVLLTRIEAVPVKVSDGVSIG